MNALLISDKDYQTETYRRLKDLICSFLKEKGFEAELIEVGKEDLTFCMGCFGCWVKKPGECVINDRMTQINRNFINSTVVIYLSPIIFGQFSANIKNSLDRWIPNMLPFFETRPDGSTIHPPRYDRYPGQFVIGYGNELAEEDKQLFIDIIKKHRRNVEVLIYQGDDQQINERLKRINPGMVGGQL
ncbi:flavodoxin family protein [Candidatus Formimonas warabiya]|uniref:Flavodoxin n=1 Tax=Formimonas warabiya TaxID=1761012 RepID=A0A3G1KZW3_FORW1|nr:flavodoxin family protein [Candidatus Formimonas warabiya]ATW27938.1 flavodoxin [Candidatus Formimonas warabiya]